MTPNPENINYDYHTGLNFNQIVDLKAAIDQNTKYPYKYWFTGTWNQVPSWGKHLLSTEYGYPLNNQAKQEFEAIREQQTNQWLIALSNNTKAHLLTFSAISRPYINKHWHSIILSDKPITYSNANRLWREGIITMTKYNPRWAEDNGEASYRGSVNYTFGKHHEHRRIQWGDIYCPAKRKSCRNGNCAHRQQQYKMTTKTQTHNQ